MEIQKDKSFQVLLLLNHPIRILYYWCSDWLFFQYFIIGVLIGCFFSTLLLVFWLVVFSVLCYWCSDWLFFQYFIIGVLIGCFFSTLLLVFWLVVFSVLYYWCSDWLFFHYFIIGVLIGCFFSKSTKIMLKSVKTVRPGLVFVWTISLLLTWMSQV
jgi:hypothetical protein